jgi:hypothetical protein
MCHEYSARFVKIGTGVQGFASEISNAVILVLFMGGIYNVRR